MANPFQDCLGNPIANGTLVIRLSHDAVDPNGKAVTSQGSIIKNLDVNGLIIPFFLWANSDLNDGRGFKTTYNIILYTANGQKCWETTFINLVSGTVTEITTPPTFVT